MPVYQAATAILCRFISCTRLFGINERLNGRRVFGCHLLVERVLDVDSGCRQCRPQNTEEARRGNYHQFVKFGVLFCLTDSLCDLFCKNSNEPGLGIRLLTGQRMSALAVAVEAAATPIRDQVGRFLTRRFIQERSDFL